MSDLIKQWGVLVAEELADAARPRQRINTEFVANLNCLAPLSYSQRNQVAKAALAWMHGHGALIADDDCYYFPHPNDTESKCPTLLNTLSR